MDSFHNILSFNACGLSAHTITDLKRFNDLNDVDIICIQETKFNDKIIRKVPGYTLENKIFKNDKDNFYGGLATYFKHGINYKNMNVDNVRDQNGEIKIEVQAFEIYSSGIPHILANIYSRGCGLESLNNLSSFILAKSKLKELMITGDFNSHHPLWGAQRSDSHVRAVFEWVEQKDLVLLNDGSPTRLDPGRGIFTCLDLTFTSPKLANFPILISLCNSKSNLTTKNSNLDEKFIFEKADWDLFKILCEDISLADIYHDSVESFLKNISEKCLSIARGSISDYKT